MKEYVVPVVFRTVNELIVKAENQTEAISKVNEIIKNNEKVHLIYDNFKILETEIECLQDDEILEEVMFQMKNSMKNVIRSKYRCIGIKDKS